MLLLWVVRLYNWLAGCEIGGGAMGRGGGWGLALEMLRGGRWGEEGGLGASQSQLGVVLLGLLG